MKIRLICVCAVSFFLSSAALCQQFSLSGKIISPSGEPVPFCSVVLNNRDTTFTTGGIANEKGIFVFHKLPANQYLATVSHIGYSTLSKEIALDKDTDLGTIELSESGTEIEAVSVRADYIKRRAGGYDIRIKDNPIAEGRTAMQLINVLPGVKVQKGVISINGIEGSKVYIDGREVKDRRELSAIDAEMIERMNIQYVSGAAYDAQDKGGIINIRLSRQRDGGYSGNVRVSGGMNLESGLTNGGVSSVFNYGGRKIYLYNSLSISDNKTITEYDQETEYRFSDRFIRTRYETKGWSKYFSDNLTLHYDINPRHTISGTVRYRFRYFTPLTLSDSRIFQAGAESGGSGSRIREKNIQNTYHAALNYGWKINDEGSDFRLVLDYQKYNERTNIRYREFDGPVAAGAPESRFTDYQRTESDLAEASGRFNLVFGDLSLGFGGKGYYYRTPNTSRWYDFDTGTGILDQEESYNDRLKKAGLAAFLSADYEVGKFSFNAGVRYQYDYIRYLRFSTPDNAKAIYRNFFPTVGIGYELADNVYANLVYEKGIDYMPNFELLPVKKYENEYSYSIGNPDLEPAKYHLLQLSLSLPHNTQFYFNYYHVLDDIFFLTFTDPDDKLVKYTRPVNIGKQDALITGLGNTFQPAKNWTLRTDIQYQFSKFIYSDEIEDNRQILSGHFYLRMESSLKFGNGWTWRFQFGGETRTKYINKLYYGTYYFGTTIQKYLLDRKLLLSVSSVPFYSKLRNIKTRNPEFVRMNRFRTSQSNISFSLRYSFKKGKSSSRTSQMETLTNTDRRTQ